SVIRARAPTPALSPYTTLFRSQEIVDAIEDCGFFESIPLWAVTLIGGLFVTVLSFIMIMSVYGRFFRLYLYTAIAPVPLSTFARSEEHTSELQSRFDLVCRLLL